ncbi:uncharacterized protein LOC133379298 [Rhineura floridana]|uniref:uncharacterized protein LOC133379298 n=1 Tax=Rhineura floridana TaxID=261503 RepID=UPI002AC802FF|nr:uncharacterized protein LOC133379298 [Rhineura floridana]XP_061470285.1 uncharacterized protein LOC133379298 [Rhineura floridana]
MTEPINRALDKATETPKIIASLLPMWEQGMEKDNHDMVNTMQSLQQNISLAITCTQMQNWAHTVALELIHMTDSGFIPREIRSLIRHQVSKGERKLEDWWSLVNATYDRQNHALRLFIVMVEASEIITVYPVIPLGITVDQDLVLYAQEVHQWAIIKHARWVTINVKGCQHHKNLGFVCEDDSLESHHDCFSLKMINVSSCSFMLRNESSSTIVYSGHGCMCLRTFCDYVVIDKYYIQPMLRYINRCFCGIEEIVGCDFSFKVPVWTIQRILVNPDLFQHLKPIVLGYGLVDLQKLLSHPVTETIRSS